MDSSPEKRTIQIKNYVPPMMKPGQPTYITAEAFWPLLDEGWRFFIGEDGRVLGYVPPKLGDRIAQLYSNGQATIRKEPN